MSESVTAKVATILAEADDTDAALRAVVALVAGLPGAAWAGIAFSENGTLAPGPEAGTAAPSRRRTVPVLWQGTTVGELQADGDLDHALLVGVAELLPAHVLLGWDTAGEAWEP